MILKREQKALDLLLSANANPNLLNAYGETALHSAIDDGDIESASKLIPKTNLNLKNKIGHTPLIAALESPKTREFAQLILNEKPNVNVKDNEGNSPLIWAACAGDADFVIQLIKSGADLDAENHWEETAVSSVNSRILALENEIALDVPDKELRIQSVMQYQTIIKLLLNAGARDVYGQTPIMRATLVCTSEDEACSIVQEWISKKADVNATNNHGWTAASYAVKYGRPKILKLLIQAGADLSIPDHIGSTPLFGAIEEGRNPR